MKQRSSVTDAAGRALTLPSAWCCHSYNHNGITESVAMMLSKQEG